jgi:hypothetical protein
VTAGLKTGRPVGRNDEYMRSGISRWFASQAQPHSVHYAFTHDDSTHSIAPQTFGHTKFDLPALTPGLYDFVAVANGIAYSIRVNVLAGAD